MQNEMRKTPCLYIVVPCYNEEAVLPITKKMFAAKLSGLIEDNLITPESRVLLMNDGSSDNTWSVICDIVKENSLFVGASLSRNRGHQNVLLAGLMEAKDRCDITISIDADGQDDINAMDEMVKAYLDGAEIVYGVRNKRTTDTWFKRFTAEGFYKLLNKLGAEVVFNHADYRLLSSRVLREFANFHEVNLFLRGLIPLVGFKSTSVYYERHERIAGESHYPLSKMLTLAFNGITSLSVKPIRLILSCGVFITCLSILFAICLLVKQILGDALEWTIWLIPFVGFLAGLQFISIGIIGEYIGKIYLETKARPRFIINERVGL
ncbi:MAG: glycosyltransferase family 2 protein [Synergistaceae bacterium]|nr:glycosyltransferase family 2 protein [Synergistaceae bacterium]